MAVVYAATHRNRKRFALKMLHPELATRGDLRARFIREGYVANSVGHPGVVSVLDDDVTEDGSTFLVMELLDGATIEGFAPRTQPLPLRESLAIALDVLAVLATAHEKSIVHRDIKPANIFVTREGQVKILDFGIARLRDATLTAKATATGATLGTPAFMAPEQALGMASEVDARTDLWGLGATLFTMLSGLHVHPGENAQQVMVRAATEPARSLSRVASDVPSAVSDWLEKALLFDKLARWESASAMRSAGLQIQQELFGPAEQGNIKRLFELRAVDIAHSPTELSPTSALSSAVHELNRSTLRSHVDGPDTSPSLPALRLDEAPPQRSRRSLAWIALATLVLVIGLMWSMSRPTRLLETTLSAASASLAAIPPPTSESSPAAAPAQNGDTPAPVAAGTAPARTGVVVAASTSPPSAVAKRGGLMATSPRVQVPALSTVGSQPSALPSPAQPAPAVSPKQNPLQLDIQ